MFSVYYQPFLNWLKVIQRCHRTQWSAVGQATESGDTWRRQLRRGLTSLPQAIPWSSSFELAYEYQGLRVTEFSTGSSKCPFRAKALLLPRHFQRLPPAPFMLSFPISAHSRTDASKSHVTSSSVHPCAADQYCKPLRSVAQINKWLVGSLSIHGVFPFHAKNSSRASCLPFMLFTHIFCDNKN